MSRPSLLSAILLSFAALVVSPLPTTAQDPIQERIRGVLSRVPLIDGHNDLPGAIRGATTPEVDPKFVTMN